MKREYPPAIREWLVSQAENQPDITYAALMNIEVRRTAICMLAKRLKGKSQREENEICQAFIDFCSRASALVFLRPAASKKRGLLCHEFPTPGELATEACHIAEIINSLRNKLIEHESWFHAPDLLATLIRAQQHPQIVDPDNASKTLPNHGDCAGRNGWRNHLYRQLCTLNDATRANYTNSFICALASALSMTASPIEPSLSRYLRKNLTSGKMDDQA